MGVKKHASAAMAGAQRTITGIAANQSARKTFQPIQGRTSGTSFSQRPQWPRFATAGA